MRISGLLHYTTAMAKFVYLHPPLMGRRINQLYYNKEHTRLIFFFILCFKNFLCLFLLFADIVFLFVIKVILYESFPYICVYALLVCAGKLLNVCYNGG